LLSLVPASADANRPLLALKDVLWLLHFYPVRWVARVCPTAFLEVMETAVGHTYRSIRIRERRLAAARMSEALGLSAEAANDLASRFIGHAVRRAHFDLRVLSGRACFFPTGSTIVGREHLDRAIADQKGVLLLGVHRFGTRQALLALRELGYPILTVRASQVSAAYGRLGRRWAGRIQPWVLERTFPDRVSPGDPDLILKILGRLRAGGAVFMTADTQRARNAVLVPFLDATIRVNPGVLEVCRLAGSRLLPLDGLYDEKGIRIEFSAPLDLRSGGTRADCARDNLRLLVTELERLVRACPDQWTKWVDL
jgi:lauroyl/myristoyl acyltransferase